MNALGMIETKGLVGAIEAVDAMVKGGHEVAFHGYLHEGPNTLPRDEEHYWL